MSKLINISYSKVKQLLFFFLIAALLNYVIWIVMILPDIFSYSFPVAAKWLLKEVYQTLIETAVLFLLSMLVAHLCMNTLKRARHQWKRLFFLMFYLFIFDFLMAFITAMVYARIYSNFDDLYRIRIIAVDGTVISFITAAYVAFTLFKQNNEQKKAAIQARYELLNVEIDPHYVFNGLSTLSGLISEDTDSAEKFLGLFSRTFRYLLDNKDRRVMTVREEYDFVSQYEELIAYRYDHVTINLDPAIRQVPGLIPTASLQLLVENAVKHNCHTSDKELTISISYKEGHIEVENNSQPLDYSIPTTKVGLKNLCERYSYLSDKKPQIIRTDTSFIVRIPVLFEEDFDEEIATEI